MSEIPHVVLSAAPAWSHLRTLCVLAAKLLEEREVVATFVVPNWMNMLQKVEAEIARALKDVPKPKGTLRVVALGKHSTTMNPSEMIAVGSSDLPGLWAALKNQSSLQCGTGKTYPAAAQPSVAILDGFLYPWFEVARAALPGIAVVCWASGTALGHCHVFVPKSHGGLRSETPVKPSGEVVQLPGLPSMYDWELVPSHMLIGIDAEKLESLYATALREANAVLTPCTSDFDGPEPLALIDKWLLETGRPAAFNVGPLMPFKKGTTEFSAATLDAEMKSAPPGVGDTLMAFLDKALKARGKRSVVYICFGSFFWPGHNVDHLWALLKALADRDIPFILSASSPMAQVPESIKELYQDSSKGLIVPWSPQQSLMAHKAIGWFVTHGGAGGTMDAMTQGVPMIGWPFIGDQPANIAYLTHTADVAFTLYEVRNGEYGLKPILSTGKTPTGTLDAFKEELQTLLNDMEGPIGARKRHNVEQKPVQLAKSWGEGGSARKAFEAFCTQYRL